MERIRLYFLIGSTATGKGAAGAELAQRIGAEIVSLDSMKVYRGLDIGTAKPPEERRRRIPYHMIDVVDPHEHYSTALYAAGAEQAAAEICSRGAKPLFVGGTALYLKAITEGLFEGPAADPAIRARLRLEAAEQGTGQLHRRLAEVDPAAAARIHSNDLRRIERALEVYEKTGTRISDLQSQFGRRNERYDPVLMGVRRERADLLARIDARVDRMMDAGLLAEVERLVAGPRPLGQEAAQAVGYRELIAHLGGACSLPEAVEQIKVHTRQLAKSQRTWFKQIGGIEWFDVGAGETADALAARLAAFLDRLT